MTKKAIGIIIGDRMFIRTKGRSRQLVKALLVNGRPQQAVVLNLGIPKLRAQAIPKGAKSKTPRG